MLAIFPRWFATTKENLHKEKSAKKEPPSPPPGGGFLFGCFWLFGQANGKKFKYICISFDVSRFSCWAPERLSRTYLAMLLVMAKKGVWVLEQPFSSLVFRMDCFQQMCRTTKVPWIQLQHIQSPKQLIWDICKGFYATSTSILAKHFEGRNSYSLWVFEFIRYCRPRFWTWNQSNTSSPLTQTVMLYTPSSAYPKVFKQSFWMRGWGSSTAKRTTLWANSSAVRFFSTTKKAKGKKSSKKLADIYYDASGRKRYKGNKALRASQ